MRIAIISTPFVRVPPIGYGGTELFCYELAQQLTATGHDVTLFATGDSSVLSKKRALYQTAQWPPSSADELNHAAWAMSEIDRGSFDVCHLNSALGVPISRFMRTPIVHTIHHAREQAASRIYAAHPNVQYVAISRRQLQLEVPLARATVIHHGVSPCRYEPSAADEGYLLHLGRFCEEKGTHLAIEAACAASMRLVLAGRTHPQDREYFEAEVAPRLLTPGVSAVGEADQAKKIALLRGARAILCPLQWEEPFGLIAIEAMLCGTPVIGFPRGSFPEIVDCGTTGFLVPDGDVEAMARVARSLDAFDRRACAAQARERFGADRMARAYEALYRRVVMRRREAA